MCRQILVHPQDRDLERIVWRSKPSDDIGVYQLNTVTYGTSCAPHFAMRTMQQFAADERIRFPDGARLLRENIYMDDILSGADTVDEAERLTRELIGICTAGGMPLRKWASNSRDMLDHIPIEHQQDCSLLWESLEGCSALGLRWYPRDDHFKFTVQLSKETVLTKRTVLSQTARLFDPMGWLAPVVIRAKLLIRRLWMKGQDWDAALTPVDEEEWSTFRAELPLLSEIIVPRWLGSCDLTGSSELHGFADASEKAYAAVVYHCTRTPDGRVAVTLLTAKSKVSPLKQVTLPRLELAAAHLLSRLLGHLRRIVAFSDLPVHCWSDSMVALSWIRGHPSKWLTFVANRVSAIQTSIPDASWRHVLGTDNPADCASRGVSPGELRDHALWWKGPAWLSLPASEWPISSFELLSDVPETRPAALVQTATVREHSIILKRFSKLRFLLRVTVWCLRWCPNSPRRAALAPANLLSLAEVEGARLRWIRLVQAEIYFEELAALTAGQSVSKRSPLSRFGPILDSDGILRVGGRLRRAVMALDQRHPIILPWESHLTRLIVMDCHDSVLHGGVQATLIYLRRTYWVPRGRAVVKSCIHHCVRCIRWRATIVNQQMADLPAPRVLPTRPFQHTGLDYAGPFSLKLSGGRGCKTRKGFICVCICFCSRAVHLELVSDYTSEAFLAALRRFVSRRGLPSDLYSDQGTTFTGADKMLRDLFKDFAHDARAIFEGVERLKITWHFNPPASPYFGGLWEAAVKSVKYHLRRVLGEHLLTYEEMTTLLTQIEACLNSRPLQPLSDDPEDVEPLTPGHFLIGTPLNAVPEPSFLNVATNRLKRWEMVQQMRDHFWKRWREEHLTALHQRPKWLKSRNDFVVGRLCLVRSELSSPGRWPLARIIAVHPGDDGLVRVVTVKTATSELKRPVVKLVLLPEEDNFLQ